MTIDERKIISDLMEMNGFESINAESSELGFQKIENNECIRVFLAGDFPFYAEARYTSIEVPDQWTAKKTLMLKSFDKVKNFAETEINTLIENLKSEFHYKVSGEWKV